MTTKENSSAHLIVEQCEQLAAMMFQDGAALPPGLKQKELLKLAQGYRNLAEMKNFLSGKVN